MARPIFRQQPRINISELRMQYISASYPAEITSSTGQLSYKYLRQLPLIESSDGVFTNDFVGGRLVVESPQNITPSTGSGVIASGYSTRYQGTITSVINNSLAVVSPPYYFKLLKESNGYTNPISYYFSPSKFDSSDYTITYRKNESGSQVTNDIYQSFVNVELADLIPESGRVSAVRLFARSQGFKTFEHLSDEPLLPVELFVNLTSSTNEYVPIGKIKDTNHVNFYWTSEIVNGDSTRFDTAQTYDKTVLTDALKVEITTKQIATFPIGRENFYAKFYTNNPIKVYKNNDYIVTFKLANVGKNDWEYSSAEVRGPRLLFAISGSAIKNEDGQLGKVYDEIKSDSLNTTTPSIVNGNGLIYQNQFDYNAGDDDNIVPTPLNGSQSFAISDNQLLVNSPVINDIRAYIFRPERDGYINPVFAVNTGIWYISDISIKPYVLDGRTPTHTRVKAKAPTYKQNDSLDIKLEFLNEQGEIANISFLTSSLPFSGSSIAVSSGGGTSGPDGDWYDGGTYITTSKAVHITASFESSGSFTANVTGESFNIIGLQDASQGSYSSLIIDNAGKVWKTGSVAGGGGGGVDNDWFDGGTYLTTSAEVQITSSHLRLSNGSIYGDASGTPIIKVQNDQFVFVADQNNNAGVQFSSTGPPMYRFTDLAGNSLVRFALNQKEHLFSGSISASGELRAGLPAETRGYFVAYDPSIDNNLVYQSTSSIINSNASIISGAFAEASNSIVNTIDIVSGSFVTTIDSLQLGDNDWFDGGTYLTTSKDVEITGSLYVSGASGVVISGSDEVLLSLKQLTSGENVKIVLTNGNDKSVKLKNTDDNSFSIDSAEKVNVFKIASNATSNQLGISASGVIIGANINQAVNNRFIVNKQATIISGAFIQTKSGDVYFENLENQSTEYYVSYNQSTGKITYTDTSSIISNNASIISGAFTEVSNSIVNTISSVSTSIISTIDSVSGSFATTIENLQLGDNDWFDTGTYLTTSRAGGVQITASADVNQPALFLYRPHNKDVGFQIENSVATYKLRAGKDEFVIDGDANNNVLRIYKNSSTNGVVISGSGVTIGENSVDDDTFTVNQDKLIFTSAPSSTELQLTGSLRQTGSPIITFEHLPEGAPKPTGFVLYDYDGNGTPIKYRLYYTGSDAIPGLLGLQNLNYWRLENNQLTSSLSIVLSGSNPDGQIFVENLYPNSSVESDTDGYPVVYYETSSGQLVRQGPSNAQRILSAERVTATYPSSVGATRRITNKNIEIVNGYFAITGSGGIKTISDVEITGSLNVTGSVNLNSPIIVSSSNNTMGFDVEDIFIIKNSNDTLLKIKNSGLLVLKSFETEPTAEEGAIYYNSSSFEFFVGVGQ